MKAVHIFRSIDHEQECLDLFWIEEFKIFKTILKLFVKSVEALKIACK